MNTSGASVFPKVTAAILAGLFLISLGFLSYGNYMAGSVPWQMLVSTILLSVPLGMLYFSIGLLTISAWLRRRQGHLTPWLERALYRTPRIAGVLITIFVGLFALDVFSEGYTFWEMIGGFLIHAAPAIVMAIVLALAWKREWIGFVAFLLVALFFMRFFIRNPLQNIGILLLFSGPMIAIALLFGANWRWKIKV